jgi:hypothetical protein
MGMFDDDDDDHSMSFGLTSATVVVNSFTLNEMPQLALTTGERVHTIQLYRFE